MTLSHQQVEDLANACQAVSGEDRDYTLIHLLAYSCPRINEALALQKKHLNFQSARVDIEQTWKTSTKGGRTTGHPKNGEPRVAPLIEHVIPMLERLTENIGEEDWVFTQTNNSNALWANNWRNRVWSPAIESIGFDEEFPQLTPHTLRHTGITFAIAAGADIKGVQALAGHTDANMTLNVYGHLFPDKLEDVRSLMSEHRAASVKPALRLLA